jgi:hypothetical protein
MNLYNVQITIVPFVIVPLRLFKQALDTKLCTTYNVYISSNKFEEDKMNEVKTLRVYFATSLEN